LFKAKDNKGNAISPIADPTFKNEAEEVIREMNMGNIN
jgi:hypothetical protein